MIQNVVESRSKVPLAVNVKAKVAKVLLEALSTQCKSYCVLSGYERLPDDFDTDIDFMVHQEDFQRMPRMIEEVGRRTNTRLFQAIDHELTGRAYFLGFIDGPSLTIVQPDCASDYRHFGRCWLSATEVLAARRLHPGGFYIPSIAHEFAYSLIKCLNKRSFNREDGYQLHRLYVGDRIECGRMIARFCRGPEGSAIVRMASANNWTEMYGSIEIFRTAMLRSRRHALSQKLKDLPQNALYLIRRIMQPTGCWIAFMGPDGCGKSLVLNAVSRQFASAFRAIRHYHRHPEVVGRNPANEGPVTDPHEQPLLGRAASIAKVLSLWLEYILGYAVRILPDAIRAQLTLFDGCFYDLLVDRRRIRYGGPPWLLRAAARLSPRPDLVILLDTPSEVLRTRQPEVPFHELERRRAAYLELTRNLPSTAVLNAEQQPEQVINDAIQAITDYLVKRAGKRLRLSATSPISQTGMGSSRPR